MNISHKMTIVTILATATASLSPIIAHADQKQETVTFRYDSSAPADVIYRKLKHQARLTCGQLFSPKAERLCINDYLQKAVTKIDDRYLAALLDKRMRRQGIVRQYDVVSRDQKQPTVR